MSTDAPIPDVCLIEDVARALKTSVRTIQRRRRFGAFPIPELPSIDKRPRWAGEDVRRFLASARQRALLRRAG